MDTSKIRLRELKEKTAINHARAEAERNIKNAAVLGSRPLQERKRT